MCGGGGGGVGGFIAPILGIMASIAMPYLAPALLPLEAGLIGAGIGAGTNLLGSAITGRQVDPLGVAIGAATGGAGGYLGAGGFGDLANTLGLGAGTFGSQAGGALAETAAGTAAAESATPFLSGAGTAGPVSGVVGQTAASAGFTPEGMGPEFLGGSLGLGPPGVGPAATPSTTSQIFSTLGKGYEAVKGPLSAASTVGTLANAAKAIVGGGEQPSGGATMAPPTPSYGGRYTTAQATPYGGEGGLGGMGGVYDPNTARYVSGQTGQYRPRGTFGSASQTLLG